MKNFIDPKLKRQIIVVAVISLLLASALELYTFGLASDFLERWFRSFFVFFILIGFTVLAIVPSVNAAVNKVMGR
jgi:hypothetical protein